MIFAAAFSFTACEDEQVPFDGPYILYVTGPSSVSPESTETYSIGNLVGGGPYTWSVTGPAEIVGESTGTTVTVEFGSVGDVVISATNGTDSGILNVEVADVEPAVATELDSVGTDLRYLRTLRSGETARVSFMFAAPLAKTPSIEVTSDSTEFNDGDAFVSGSISELMQGDDEFTYYADYTAGSGNGTPEALISDIIATSGYGSDTVETAYVQLYRVDNIAPTADLSYSQVEANDSTVVTVTATFSEPVMGDSLISFSGGGVDPETATLQPTDDELVYTYEYTVNGEGAGPINVELEGITDLAGNPLAGVNNSSELVVDNIAPIVTLSSAMDEGEYASIELISTEAGTGMYLIMEEGEEGPATAVEFMEAEGVASGSMDLIANAPKTAVEALESGNYVVYFLAQDNAGNYSAIDTTNLVMD